MWGQIIATLIFVVGTFASVLEAIYLTNLLKQKLPEHTRVALEQFSLMAARQVEQQNPGAGGPAKKQLAVSSVLTLFNAFGLPEPVTEAVNISIEAAVLLLPKTAENHSKPE